MSDVMIHLKYWSKTPPSEATLETAVATWRGRGHVDVFPAEEAKDKP